MIIPRDHSSRQGERDRVERNPLTGHSERRKERRVKSSTDHYGFLFFVSDSVKGEEWKWNDIRVCRWKWWERLVRKEFLNKRPPEKGEYLPYCNDTTGREERNPCLSPTSTSLIIVYPSLMVITSEKQSHHHLFPCCLKSQDFRDFRWEETVSNRQGMRQETENITDRQMILSESFLPESQLTR